MVAALQRINDVIDKEKPSANEGNEKKQYEEGEMMGMGIAIGLALGAGIGAAMDNLALGIAIGMALGVSIGAAMEQNRKDD